MIMFNVADIEPATQVFLNTTIAHDKGKPAVRRGRKAVNLLKYLALEYSALTFGRLSGCRRRSGKVRTWNHGARHERFTRGAEPDNGSRVLTRTADELCLLCKWWFYCLRRISPPTSRPLVPAQSSSLSCRRKHARLALSCPALQPVSHTYRRRAFPFALYHCVRVSNAPVND
jgi:hypothetical protein